MPGGEQSSVGLSVDAGLRLTIQEELEALLASTRDPMQRKSPRVESGELQSYSVLSLGWQGSSRIPELIGSAEAHQRPDRLFEVLANVIERCGGYVDSYQDDRLVAVFGSRQRDAVSSENAVRAGLSMMEICRDLGRLLDGHGMEFAVRIGVDFAEMPENGSREDAGAAAVRDTANVARGLRRAARPGTVLVSRAVASPLGDIYVWSGGREIEVDGKPERTGAVEVEGANVPRIERWHRRKSASSEQFYGRVRELRAFGEFYREASRCSYPPEKWEITRSKVPSRNRFLGLKGPAGCGKSRLVKEFIRRLRIKRAGPVPLHLVGRCPVCPEEYLSPFVQMILHRLNLPASANPHEKKLALDMLYFGLEKGLPGKLKELKERLQNSRIAVGHLLEAPYDFSDFNQLDARSQDIEKRVGVRSLLEVFYYEANKALLPKLLAFWDAKPPNLRMNVGRPGSTIPELPEGIRVRPLVIQIDDLHRAGESTLGFLQFLFETMSIPQPVVFIGTYGSDFELPMQWARSVVPEETVLERMADYELRMILHSMLSGFKFSAELEMEVFDKAEGNPLFVEELVYYMLAERFMELDESEHTCRIAVPVAEFSCPAHLRELALGLADMFDPPVKTIMQMASVLGREFTVKSLAHVASEHKPGLMTRDLVEGLEGLEGAGILIHGTEGSGVLDHMHREYRFHHGVHQEAAYASITPYSRALFHRATAELLEVTCSGRTEQHLAALAHHWERAGTLTTAARYWVKLSYRQMMQGGLEEARSALDHARDLVRRIKGDEDARLHLDLESKVALANVLISLRRHQEAEQLCGEVRALAMAHHLTTELSDAERMLGVIFRERHRYIEAEQHLQAAAHMAREDDDAVRVSQALNNLGLLYWELQQYPRSLAAFDEALRIARKAKDKRVVAAALCNAGLAHGHSSGYRNGLELLERALSITEEMGDRWGRACVISNIAFFWSSRGRYERAKEYSSQVDSTRKELGIEGRGLIAWWV